MERSTISMIMFLLVFLLIYGGLHLYMFLRARAGLGLGTKTSVYFAAFLMLMVFAPILTRLFEKPGVESIARAIAYVGYTWMAILFLFFSVSIVIDLLRLLVYLGGSVIGRGFPGFTTVGLYHFLIPFGLALAISFYGYFEARDIRTERITIQTSKLPQDIGRLKIVQISDIHLGVVVGEGKLKRILDIVRKENPDILVSTGDLVDGEMCNLLEAVRLLGEIDPPYGKFAITGNHEFYAGLDRALAFTEDAGFTILRGDALTPGGILNIAGVDDPEAKRFGSANNVPERELLSGLPEENFTLFLKHRPVLDKNALGLFDLQLSGHAHKGQIFPFSLLTKLSYPTDDGCLKLEDGSYLCVSRGAGTWGPPIRFLAPPDVVVIELVRK